VVVLGSGGQYQVAGGECGEIGGETGVKKESGEWRPACAGRMASGEKFAIYLAGFLCVLLGGCGYHVAGRSEALPKSIHVIAVPALENKTTSYRIEQRLTAATVHEFLGKTPYRVVSDPANGDAVLRGKVLSLEAVPLLFETKTGRATTMLVTVKCEVTFEERETGKVLYHTDNFLFRNQYEISTDVKSFFEEQDPALERLAQDFAARLVAAVIENY
jgi:outer membrane lipopolysaccharide assembly protein LptE/RlpB